MWGKQQTMGLRAELSAQRTRTKLGTYQALKCGKKCQRLQTERGSKLTIHELLFIRLCANSNGVCKEVSFVPARLSRGEEAKISIYDILTG
jgi:hypothetical protein